jgi:hypothetical protein
MWPLAMTLKLEIWPSSMSLPMLAQALTACQDRKREGDLLFGGGNFEAAEQVYRDAAAPLLAYTGADGTGGFDVPSTSTCPTHCRTVHEAELSSDSDGPRSWCLLSADGADAARKAAVMRMILLQNRAACCHKLHRFAEAVELCTEGRKCGAEGERKAERQIGGARGSGRARTRDRGREAVADSRHGQREKEERGG